MTSRHIHYVLFGLIGLLVIGLMGGAYQTDKLLTAQATKLVSLKAKSSALDKEQLSLKSVKKQLALYSDLNKTVSSIIPQDKDQANAVREIVNIAAKNKITLGSITFPASTLGTTSFSKPTPGGASTSSKPFTTPATTSKTSSLSQLQPIKDIPGVYNLQITIQGDANVPVPYDQFIAFLSDLEHNRRTAQVNTITLVPDIKDARNLTFSIILDEYIKP